MILELLKIKRCFYNAAWKSVDPGWDVQTSNLGRAVEQSLVGSTPILFRQ